MRLFAKFCSEARRIIVLFVTPRSKPAFRLHLRRFTTAITALALIALFTPVATAQTESGDEDITFEKVLWFAGLVAVAVIAGVVTGLEDQEDISPELVTQDENGRVRQLHEYFGEYPWASDGTLASMPDHDVMTLWLLQLQYFDYDHGKIHRQDETWQSVPYTWRHERGVCRDSATLLADLLRAVGYDARLAVGDLVEAPNFFPGPDTGHAWVVVRDPDTGNEYLLESTQETWDRNMRVPPRTFTSPEYIPEMQVTKDMYLTRRDDGPTTAYTEGWDAIPAQ
jgi:hypothetical protein